MKRSTTMEDAELVTGTPWLLDRHIVRGSTGFLCSTWRDGASALAVDLAVHIAMGTSAWHGYGLNLSASAAVLYLTGRIDRFWRQYQACRQAHGFADRPPHSFEMITRPVCFDRSEDVDDLLATIRAMPRPPSLIVVDPLTDVLAGRAYREVAGFMGVCHRLRDECGAATLAVCYDEAAGESPVSEAIDDLADFRFDLEPQPQAATMHRLIRTKMKDDVSGSHDDFVFTRIEHGEGRHGLAVERVTPEQARELRAMGAMQAAWDTGRPWALYRDTHDRWARSILVREHRFSPKEARSALARWLAECRVEDAVCDQRIRVRGLRVVNASMAPGKGG